MDWYQLDRITGLKGLTPTHAAGIVATTAVHEERVKKVYNAISGSVQLAFPMTYPVSKDVSYACKTVRLCK